jgi:hypothetical protein
MKQLNIDEAFAYRFLHGLTGSLIQGTLQEREMRKAFAYGVAELYLAFDRMGTEFSEEEFSAFMENVRLQLLELDVLQQR